MSLSRMFRSSRYPDPLDMAGIRPFEEEDKGGDIAFYGMLVDAITGDPSPVLRRLVDALFSYIDRHAEPHHTEHIEPSKVAWYSRVMGDASPEVYTRHPWYLQTYYEAMKIPYEFILSPSHPGQQIPILSREGYLADWLITIRTEPKDAFMSLRRAIDRFHLVDPLTGYRFPLLPWKALPQTGSATLRGERERWHSRSHERLQQVMHETTEMYEQHAERHRDRVSSRYMGHGTYVGGGAMLHDVNPNNAYIYNHGPTSRAFLGHGSVGAYGAYMHGGHHDLHGYGHGGHGHGHGHHGGYPYEHHGHGSHHGSHYGGGHGLYPSYEGYGSHSHHSHSHSGSYGGGGGSYSSHHSDGGHRSRPPSRNRSRPPSRDNSRERERERERERQLEREYEQERSLAGSYAGSSSGREKDRLSAYGGSDYGRSRPGSPDNSYPKRGGGGRSRSPSDAGHSRHSGR